LKKQIVTAYGTVELEVRAISGSQIYVTHERCIFPAGTKTRGGAVMKKNFLIPRGAVLIPTWENFGGKNPKRLHHIFPNGLYEALRWATHAIRKYGLRKKPGELQILRDISNRLARDLAVLMEGRAASSRELADVQLDLAHITAELGRPIEQLKAEAAEKIAEAATLEVEHPSGTRSKNIPATKQRVSAAKTRVDERRNQIGQIGPRVNFFEQVLAQTIGGIFDDLGSLRNIVQAEQFQISLSFSPKVRHIFVNRANFALQRLLPQLDAAPFLKTARMIRVDLAKAKAAKSKDFALAAIDRILAAIRLKESQRAFEARVILPLALNEDMCVTTEADFRHTLQRLSDFALRFHREINDSGFLRPVKTRVLDACRNIVLEEFGPVTDPDAERLKERLKTVSNML